MQHRDRRSHVELRAPLLTAAALLALALGAHQVRRALIRSFFVDGAGTAASPLALAPAPGARRPAQRTRVVLLDGLSRKLARGLPVLSALCSEGLELTVDAGFPTVSLPVQHVLWTGLTQQQSGVGYRVALMRPAVADSIPGRVPGSIAVAEAHPEIVHSFGFSGVAPPAPAGGAPADWRAAGFAAAAREAVRSDAPLAFVHVLRIDEAGHRDGGASPAYRDAAASADALLGDLLKEERAAHQGAGTAWFVLSDHGHLDAGGHGDTEERVRLVRACIVAPGLPPARPGTSVHLIDLSRALADQVGVPLRAGAAGRPLEIALLHPAPGATLPRPAPLAWALALLLLIGPGAAGVAAGRGALRLPCWLPLAYASVVLLHGPPTLSNRIVYPPQGRDMMIAALPGLAVLLACMALSLRRTSAARAALSQLGLLSGATLAALVLCGGLGRLLGLHREPPLMPWWTGHASLLLSLCVSSATVAALPALASAARAASGPSPPAGSAGTDTPAP